MFSSSQRTKRFIQFFLLPLPILVLITSTPSKHKISAKNIFSRLTGCSKEPRHGGDCQVIGPRRPDWDCYDRIRSELPEFLKLYSKRPLRPNYGGMRVENSFGMWYMLRNLSPPPTTVIESGVNKGHTTWMILQSLPSTRVISIDPSSNIFWRSTNVTYLTGDMFEDFSKVPWQNYSIDFDRTVVFIDDHQSSFRRIVSEGHKLGFRRFLIDDNYDYLSGDSYSVKWACEMERKSQWRGLYLDNFAKTRRNMTWEEHVNNGKELQRLIQVYYEFPPIACAEIFARELDDEHRATPLFCNMPDLRKTGFDVFDELRKYAHMTYVETG